MARSFIAATAVGVSASKGGPPISVGFGSKVISRQSSKVVSIAFFPQVDGFTPHTEIFYSPQSPENALGRPFSGVVATCLKSRTGYHPFPQVDGFTPHTTGIYSPSLATTLVATFWLPTGYQRKSTFWGVNLDVAVRTDTIWTREHHLEKWEL